MKFGIERPNAAIEDRDGCDVACHDVDLDGDLGLKLDKVDMGPVQGARLSGGVAQAIDEGVDEGTAVGVIAAGIRSDAPSDGGSARSEHRVGVEPPLQQSQGKACPEVRQHPLQGRRCPADQIDQAALGIGDAVLQATAL